MPLPSDYQSFIHLSRYARWREPDGRRETWEESVARYVRFFEQYLSDKHPGADVATEDLLAVESSILSLDVMPSMRCLMTAGPALERDHVAGYNCSYLPIDGPRAFDEMLYILMCGTGVGYSVERQYVSLLPAVPDRLERRDHVIQVRDSKLGWAEALRELIAMLYAGWVPQWDVSKVRPAGSILRTFGGRASGPEPLEDLFRFVIQVFESAQGRRLTSIECHDICCKIADIVVVGGVRRSALISLSNLSDQRMRDAKIGNWGDLEPQRALANNSVAYTETPEVGQFMREWLSLYESKSGERGIFNRVAARVQAGRSGRRSVDWDFGTNPCSEIILRPWEFCNLTEAVCRPDDDFEALSRKVTVAAIMGTLQSCLTDFRYLGKRWQKNCEEERLLGVSLTGMRDCPLVNGYVPGEGQTAAALRVTEEALNALRLVVLRTNKEWAERLGINQSAAATCVKPSGTASQLVMSASGMHSWPGLYYIRRVRQDSKDPLSEFMRDAGFPCETDVMKPEHLVFSFPLRAPERAVTHDQLTALDQLDYWRAIQRAWCEHKPSVTVSVREREWPVVGGYVWDHFDEMTGVTFLPRSEHSYRQAPQEVVSAETYSGLVAAQPRDVDWSGLAEYEDYDCTEGSQELACSSGVCEL